MKIFIIGIIAIFLYLPTDSSAQGKDSAVLNALNKEISKTLSRNKVSDKIKDSIAVYSYSITINVRKNKNNVQVELILSNPILNEYFPQLDQLRKIDYGPLVSNKKNQTIVLPILIINQSATAKNKYTRQEGILMVGMQSVVEQFGQMLSYLVSTDINSDELKLILKPFIVRIYNIS